MYTKDNFMNAVRHETEICKHLHGKMSEAMLAHQPMDGTRTTHELMKYLTYCGSGPVAALTKGDWSVIARFREEAASLTLANFPARMEAQRDAIGRALEGLPESELSTRTAVLPWGVTTTLGAALIDTSLRFLAAYRLQWFNHIKACGHPELSTHNAWLGKDAPAK